MKSIHTLLCVCPVSVCLIAPVSSRADGGTVELLLSGVRNISAIAMGDTTVTAGGASGTITSVRSSGGPFVEGVSGTVQCATFAKKSPSGFDLEANCAATFSPGDTVLFLFKRKSGDLVAGSSGEGTEQIMGGTGRFAGVSGQCKYKVGNFSGNWSVTTSKCQWQQ
jgi:hypothetical protein